MESGKIRNPEKGLQTVIRADRSCTRRVQELQQLISICRRQNLITHERERDGNIINVNALFTELERHNNLGIDILKTMINELKKPDLCRLIEDFERKRKQEEDAERDKKEWEDCKRKRRG